MRWLKRPWRLPSGTPGPASEAAGSVGANARAGSWQPAHDMPRGSDSRGSKKIRRPSATSVGSGAKRAVAASILPVTCGVPLPIVSTTRDGGAPGSRIVSDGAAWAASAAPASTAAASRRTVRAVPATDAEAKAEPSAQVADDTKAEAEHSAQVGEDTEAEAERPAQASDETEAQTERPAQAADKIRRFPNPSIRRRRPLDPVDPVKPSCNRTSSVTAR
ncbi:hypothetical protein EMIT0158MI4_40418 [Burkholderia ambifaria]